MDAVLIGIMMVTVLCISSRIGKKIEDDGDNKKQNVTYKR